MEGARGDGAEPAAVRQLSLGEVDRLAPVDLAHSESTASRTGCVSALAMEAWVLGCGAGCDILYARSAVPAAHLWVDAFRFRFRF